MWPRFEGSVFWRLEHKWGGIGLLEVLHPAPRGFSLDSAVSPLLKNQQLKIQFDQELQKKNHVVDVLSLNRYSLFY